MMLELDGYEHTGSAASGTEALALIEKESFEVVLLDMMMPDLNGDVVLRQIKTDPNTRDVSVIMISADTDAANVARCIELGADDYLPKPFNPSILRARITSSLQKHALRRLEAEYTATIEAEKRRSEGLLLNVLPREIAFRLLGGESNLADFFEDATVMFADVVGFTRLTAMMRAGRDRWRASIGSSQNSTYLLRRSGSKKSRRLATATWRSPGCRRLARSTSALRPVSHCGWWPPRIVWVRCYQLHSCCVSGSIPAR